MNNKKLTTKTISAVVSCLLATTTLFSQELSTITVSSATKSEQSIKDVTSNVEVITKEEIEERHFTTVNEAINTLAGINVISNGGIGKSSSVFMRGFDTQRILVLIDGIKYNDFTGISGARFENLVISDIKQIEVIKGAQSGVWGADATAGVINIITKKATNGFSGNLNLEYGSFNTKKVQTSISNKTNDYDVKFSFSNLTSDGFTTRATRGVDIDSYEDDGYENKTFNIKAGYNFNDSNRIDLVYNKIKSESEIDKSINDQYGHIFYTDNDYLNLNYRNNNKYSEVNTYVKYSRIDKDDPTGFTTKFDGDLYEYGLNSKFDYLKDSFALLGLDYKRTEYKNDVNRVLRNKGIFITNSTQFDKLVFTQSLRYDNFDLFNNKTTGKVGIKYNLKSDFSFSSNYGTAYNVPNFYNLYNSGAGFSGLEPESTNSFDFTVDYKRLSLTYFNNKVKNMIEYNSNTSKYYNIDGEVRFDGIEIKYDKEILSDLLLSLNYTYTRAKDDNNMDLQRRAEQSFKLGVDYYGIDKLHFNINGEYVGNRIQYAWGTYNVNANTGNYTLWNSVLNYDLSKSSKIYLKVDNIFNKYYQTIDGYATAPRSAYIGLTYNF